MFETSVNFNRTQHPRGHAYSLCGWFYVTGLL